MSTPDNRHSIRLRDFDYSTPGAYFVTICTHNRRPILRNERRRAAAEAAWSRLQGHFPVIQLDAMIIMPDHVHFIVALDDEDVGAGLDPPSEGAPRRAPTLGDTVRAFKGDAAREINRLRGTPGKAVWQRNYYEHIVRDEHELERVRAYIRHNPPAAHTHDADDLAAAWEEEP